MKRQVKSKASVPLPTYANVKFGSGERNYLSVWLAESDRPTPVLFTFHPGGFRRRPDDSPPQLSKPIAVKRETLRLLSAGISVVAPSHDGAGAAPFQDAVRALQFVRSKASEWNLDKHRIASTGASSGGCLSLWLAFHEDMAKPGSKDPIARESTRLACVAVNQALTSVDPRFIRDIMPGSDIHSRFLKQFYGHEIDELEQLPEETYRLMEELSPINHVSKDAPPVLLRYDHKLDAPYGIHHPNFGVALKKAMDALGERCDLVAGGQPVAGSQRKTIPTFIKDEFANG